MNINNYVINYNPLCYHHGTLSESTLKFHLKGIFIPVLLVVCILNQPPHTPN